jgi:hypothetical protein
VPLKRVVIQVDQDTLKVLEGLFRAVKKKVPKDDQFWATLPVFLGTLLTDYALEHRAEINRELHDSIERKAASAIARNFKTADRTLFDVDLAPLLSNNRGARPGRKGQ